MTSQPSVAIVAIVGPTATGKSDTAVALAHLLAQRGLAAEVVNADAMQLYRGMDIGTAKLPLAAREGVPHHLLDLWPVAHRASVVEYRAAARERLTHALAQGVLPIVVGGSGLYASAALDELDVPPTDPAVRARFEARLAERGPAALHAELAERDPAAAAAIDPANGRRLVRALEVVELTGSFTARLPASPRPWRSTQWWGLDTPATELDARIDVRTARIWRAGLLAETADLVEQGLADSPTAARAVGYEESLAVLAENLTPHAAQERTALRTRQLARRQRKWFRRDRRITWLSADPSEAAHRIAAGLF